MSLEFFISSLISSNSFGALFIKTKPLRLIFESIKDLEVKTYTVFNLDFANDTILSCFFFFFLIIDLCLLIPVVITQIYNPIAELIIPIGIPTKKAKAEIEMHPVTVEINISKCSI